MNQKTKKLKEKTLSNHLLLALKNFNRSFRKARNPFKRSRYGTPHCGIQECQRNLKNYPSLNLAMRGH